VSAAAERYGRLQAAMARHGVGAVCLATPHLAAFAAGVRRVQVAGSGGTLPWAVVIAGAPSAVVFTTDPDGVPAGMPPEAVEPLRWDRNAQLARIAALVGGTRGAVACDVFAPALREALGRRPVVDAVPLLEEAAAPRSPEEIEAIARAVRAARTVVRAVVGALRPGVAGAELHARFAAALAEVRAGFPAHGVVVRRAGVPLAPEDVVRAGDRIAVDVGLWLGGHAGVAADTALCGAPSPATRRAWSEVLCALAGACRAGTPIAAVVRTAREAGVAQAGLLAHGLGVGIEPPLVDLHEAREGVLRAGTVLVLAPLVGDVRASRALVVRDGAPHWLEAAP